MALMITAGQLRASRALLGIDQRKLAEAAGLSLPTIQRMEASEGVIRGNVDLLMKLVAALDALGIELIADNAASQSGGRGVRLEEGGHVTLTIALAGAAILLLALGGTLAILLHRHAVLCQLAGQIGAVLGSACGLVAALRVLVTGNAVSLSGIWHMPGGSLHFEIDVLSAFFLLPVFGLSIVTGLYGRSYFAGHGGIASAASWFHLNMLTASMALVIAAQDGLLFLLAWEIMALSPFFLVIFDDRKAAVRHAAWTYLVAAHLGTAFLLVLFVLLGSIAASSDFAAYGAALKDHQALRSAVFLLALVGFGVKAGIVPAHVWLPEAHPVAPSHASALMSGAMIKVGIYGLVRILTLLGTPEPWWGWLLIAVGASSGVLGVLFALAQHDLKRLLAYHSVENIGIILLGIGIGVLGLASGMPLFGRHRLCLRLAPRSQPQHLQRPFVSGRRRGPARRA